MISRIYVTPKDGHGALSYVIDSELKKTDVEKLARSLTNPILEHYSLNHAPKMGDFSYAVEIGYQPGVTDNIAHTVKETAQDLLGSGNTKLEIYTSKLYFTKLKQRVEVEKFAADLHNPLIERATIVAIKNGSFNLPTSIPKVNLKKKRDVVSVELNVSDEELAKIGKLGILEDGGQSRRGPLALNLNSMKVIRAYFTKLKRDPTDVELESLAQTWSEHCKHTIFANPIDDIKDGLYKTYIKGATNEIRKKKGRDDFCVSVFSDNAGAIAFDKDFLITHKVETHNAPSALDPVGGAITGILGVNRDTMGFGLGAKPVANTYGFCFGEPDDQRSLFRDRALTQRMMLPGRIMDGVIKGINAGGNCSGIPTLSGFVKFDERYRGKPLVFAGTLGLIPRKVGSKFSHEKNARPGDLIVVAGGRVGADGIHGATFSSVVMDASSPATAVQIGDPITQKKLSDAIAKEARDKNLFNSITDNGAGGLSCSVAEMAKECGGAKVSLEKAPLKYPGLRPWEIWISESQERMTLAVPKEKWKELHQLFKNRGVEATVIGEFTNSGKCVVNWQGKTVMDLPLDFLHNGLPKEKLHSAKIIQNHPEPKISKSQNFTKVLESLISQKNISSFSFISEQYDHEVQASSVLKPLAGAGRINTDAQVFRPILDSDKGVVLSFGVYPSYGDLSAYDMAACALDTAVRNTIAAGGKLGHLAILDNTCWASSNEPKPLGQLVDAIRASYKYAVGYGTPFISGKDSMFNDFEGYDEKGKAIKISIPPTLLISALSVMPDIYKTVSPEFKNIGDVIYVLGETNDELGAGEYYKSLGVIGKNVPKVDLNKNLKTYRALEQAIEQELVTSSLSVTSGGLAVALAKASVGGMLGADVSLDDLEGKANTTHAKLFSESQGRILVSVMPENIKNFEKVMKGVALSKLGEVKGGKFTITENKKNIVASEVKKLYRLYHSFSESMK